MVRDALHIVLVDDDEDDRDFFREAIEEIDMDTTLSMFVNGQEFLDHITIPNQKLPQIVFLDLNMPIKNGLECLKEIKENNLLEKLSVAIYSTSSSEEDIERTFVLGANVYINKPNSFKKLKKAVEEVLKVNWQYHTSNLNKENFLLRV
ncbi:response regulator [Aquimarina agarilytica]|uniref:response regulator n=1 Tax=Aquimarina agarilytica TaxID=1087449 RepID=UPI000287D292|nr:response regulator [Aquimarina agarilytica]